MIIFLLTAGFITVTLLIGADKIDINYLVGKCGFRQRYGLPCPSCFMTTSCVLFFQGRIWESFYFQPAGCFFCVLVVICGVFSFLTAVFGIYFNFLDYVFNRSNAKYIVLAAIIILAAGWAVTFARALAERQ